MLSERGEAGEQRMDFNDLLDEVRNCRVCEALPLGPRPVLSLHRQCRLLIIGQAPGLRVHQSGIAWDDLSGDRLRDWLGVERETFYDEKKIGIMPMGFCYPGKGASGDLPPRPECAPLWHDRLLTHLPKVELTLLIGQYAQKRYLLDARERNLTETVRAWRNYGPRFMPLPHPSPRNYRWLAKNPWFELAVLPALRERVRPLVFP